VAIHSTERMHLFHGQVINRRQVIEDAVCCFIQIFVRINQIAGKRPEV
jgi:hypothetical protein